MIEKLKDLGFHINIETPPKAKSSSYWVCVKDFYTEKTFISYGSTAPLAICLAALKAFRVDMERKVTSFDELSEKYGLPFAFGKSLLDIYKEGQ